MSACEIKITKGLPVVTRYPNLMDSLLEYTDFNTNEAIDLYGIALTEEYNEIVKEPEDLNSFLRYISVKKASAKIELNSEETLMLTKLNANADLFVETFTNDGVFEYDRHRYIDSGLNITDVENKMDELENIYNYLRSNEVSIPEMNYPQTERSLNLDKAMYEFKVLYQGVTSREELIDKATALEDYEVVNSEEIQDWILEYTRNFELIPVVEITEDGLITTDNKSTKNRILNTVDSKVDYVELSNYTGYLATNIENLSVFGEPKELEKFVKTLEKSLLNKGIPVGGLSEVFFNTELSVIKDYLYNLSEMLDGFNNIDENTEAKIDRFVETHDSLFNTTADPLLTEVKKNTGEFKLFSNISNATLLRDFNLLHVGDNSYKIYSVDNIDYSAYYNEELSVRFNEEFREGDNVDDVKALVFLQSVEGFSESKNLLDSRYSTAIDLKVNEFLHDFNKMLLKDPVLNDVFAFTSKGLEAKFEINQFNLEFLRSKLDADVFEKLQAYAIVSGTTSLKALTPAFYALDSKNNDILRNFYLNNPKNLVSLQSNYEKINENLIRVSDSVNDFVKVDGNIYERQESDFFGRVYKDSEANVFNVPKSEYILPEELELTQAELSFNIERSKLKKQFC